MPSDIQEILDRYAADRTRLLDILWDIQRQHGFIPEDSIAALGDALDISPGDIRETASFYHFYFDRPCGEHRIFLADTVIARMHGYPDIREALEQACGCTFGNVDPTGRFGLYDTNCIGLSDQEPAMMVDDVVFTHLTPDKVETIVAGLREGKRAETLAGVDNFDPGQHDYVATLVADNIRHKGPVFFQTTRNYRALLDTALALPPDDVIEEITRSGLRGRGGAGFPTGLKWRLGRDAKGDEKYIICNADEGEPGAFKDRVLLSRSPGDVLLGMIIAGWAVGSRHGIVYLRAEYWYLKAFLAHEIQTFYHLGLLGQNVLGYDFAFDIRIQMGAGAYVCGDETALIESCEGKRGTPRLKPPYPIEAGYLGKPTCVNNVETLASVSRIIEEGSDWFRAMGTQSSTGTRLLSVSGDCEYPGIYEIEWGTSLHDVLDMVGAVSPLAVQVSGPSGECVSVKDDGQRVFCYDDLSCNGSLMIFNHDRDLLDIVENFTRFFVDESCGICVPCRAGGVELLHKIRLIRGARGTRQDVEDIHHWGKLMHATSRCGLGTTAARPLLTTLAKFPQHYERMLVEPKGPLLPSFDLEVAMQDHELACRDLPRKDVP